MSHQSKSGNPAFVEVRVDKIRWRHEIRVFAESGSKILTPDRGEDWESLFSSDNIGIN